MKSRREELHEEIEYADGRRLYHDAMASKCYEERNAVDSAFHHSCARMFERHAHDLRSMLIIFDLVDSARSHDGA